ncbi:hypothetical protein GQ54DRAFT_308701 [Martensiomyces pterosporus]|nr:hypothetical protein GQ54DRAFT_308701 [Martensiomyces pterosporus]
MAAPPPAAHHAPPAAAPAAPAAVAQPQQPGLFAQMAATAGGVAVGSAIGHTVGHAVTGLFSGGSSDSSAQQAQQQAPPQAAAFDQSTGYSQQAVRSCDADAKAFTRCLESTNNDMGSCQYYLDMLKQCQAFASTQSL